MAFGTESCSNHHVSYVVVFVAVFFSKDDCHLRKKGGGCARDWCVKRGSVAARSSSCEVSRCEVYSSEVQA